MKIEYSLAQEDYKYQYGNSSILVEKEALNCKELSLMAARQDWAAFQVLLYGDDEFTVSVGNNPIFSTRGPLTNVRVEVIVEGMPKGSVSMFPVGLIEDDDRIMKSDILLHDEVVHVEKRKIQPIWVEVEVAEHTKPGIYAGTVILYSHAMFEDEIVLGSLSFNMEVKDVVIPEPKDYHFYLDLWQHLSNIARKHEVRLWSDEHFKVIEEYISSLSKLGQKAISVIVSEIPWSGQGCFEAKNYLSDLFEYNMIQVRKGREGKFQYDFSIMERYIELCHKYHINQEIEVFGLMQIWVKEEEGYGAIVPDYPDAIRIRYFDESDETYKYIRTENEIKQYIKAIESYFMAKDWIEKVRVVADEPADLELYERRLNVLKDIAPSLKFKAAIHHVEFIEKVNDRVTDFVPILNCAYEKWDLLNQVRNTISGRLTWYVCCGPQIPNTFIVSPLIESRFIGLLTSYMNMAGFLRWNYTVWPENPREKLSYKFPLWKAGDTNFVYPANDGRPLLTLRYKNLKRGIEDFELIQMLKQKCPDVEVVLAEIWKKIIKFTDYGEFYKDSNKNPAELYSLEYADYFEVKKLLLDKIAEV